MDQKKYIRLQLYVIRDLRIRIESRIGRSIERNTLMAHWCKRYAKAFRDYVIENRLIDD